MTADAAISLDGCRCMTLPQEFPNQTGGSPQLPSPYIKPNS